MKLRTTVGKLLDAFALTSPTLDKKGSSANLYLNANEKSGFLYLYSTNLSSETATKITAEVETPGEVLVNPSKLANGLNGLSKETPVSLTLSANNSALLVSAGTVHLRLVANTMVKELGDRMKAIPSKATPVSVIPANELIEFTKRSAFCIPNDLSGQRATLAALKLATTDEREEAFATDGSIAVHIASTKKQSNGEGLGKGLLIPSQALAALSSLVMKKKDELVSVIIPEQKNKVFFKFDDGTHFGALTMATTYPNLKPIIDQSSTFIFDVPRELLKQSLNRATSYVPSASSKRILEIEIGTDAIAIKADGGDSLSDTIAITYSGTKPPQPVRLGMDIDKLVNIASVSQSENLTFGFTNDEKPLIVTDKAEGDEDDEQIDIKYVVMGVKLAAAK